MGSLSLKLFGNFQALFDGKPVGAFRTNKAQALLIYLAVERASAHRREGLMTLLWPDMPLKSAQINLRQVLHVLRKMFPDVAPLTIDRVRVQFNLDAPVTVDAHRFDTLISQAQKHDHPDLVTCKACLERLEKAVSIYRGDFISDFYLDDSNEFEDWAQAVRENYRAKTLDALEALTGAYLFTGEYDQAVQKAERQLVIDPLRERAHRSLMEALARNGARRAALVHYDGLWKALQAEMGLDPSPETQALAANIRANALQPLDATLQLPGKPSSTAEPIPTPPKPQDTPRPIPAVRPQELRRQELRRQELRRQELRHNLPNQPTPFIGREPELAALEDLLLNPETRLVTIVGPGGMGKTRLALACAERQLIRMNGPMGDPPDRPYSDGIFFVNLAPLRDPGQIVSAVAEALNIRLQGGGYRSPQEQLLDYLHHQKLLLLMDNFEHLMDGIDLVADILGAAAGAQILVTSRERLHLRYEQVYPLDGLEFPDWETPEDASEYTAARLFIQSALRNRPDFALRDSGDLTYLARICRLVAGMPLALELAAAWVDMLPLEEIAAGLQQGLDFLETDMHDLPERHRSVRATIDYSWGQLDEKEREVFTKLSVFRSGFTRDAAKEVSGANLRQLGRLVNKSFLQYAQAPDRYQVHELLRQYGAEKLADTAAMCTVHLEFFAAFAEKAGPEIFKPDTKIRAKDLRAEVDNFRAALDWAEASGQAQAALRMFWGLRMWDWHFISESWHEVHQRVGKMLALPEAATPTPARAMALIMAGNAACFAGDYEAGLPLLEESHSLGRELGEAGKIPLGWTLVAMAMGQQQTQQDITIRQGYVAEAITLLRAAGEPWQLWVPNLTPRLLATMPDDCAEAIADIREGLVRARKNDYTWLIGLSVRALGKFYYYQGDYHAARDHLEEVLAIRRSQGISQDLGFSLLGAVALLQGDPQGAVAYFEAELEELRRMGYKPFIARAKSELGIAAGHLGDHARAAALSHEALLLVRGMENRHDGAACLLGAAGVQRSPHRAAQLLAAARTAVESRGLVLEPLCQMEYERVEKAARTALGGAAFDAAFADGETQAVEQAIATALAESPEWKEGISTSWNWERVEPAPSEPIPHGARQKPRRQELRHNLPNQPTPFIGREPELAALEDLLLNPETRLVTIVGPGGMGKTRLALACAEHQLIRRGRSKTRPLPTHPYQDGIFFVNLAPIEDAAHIVPAIAAAMKVALDAGGDPKEQLLDILQPRRMLLILDNCEHLLDGVELLADILHRAPGVTLLATSRERLLLQGEQSYPISGLAFPEKEGLEQAAEDIVEYPAVKLFFQCAKRVQPTFAPKEGDIPVLAQICSLVAGVPLGIELAAAWVEFLSLAEIAGEIQRSLDFLETEMRNIPERHRSLRAVFDATWEQLSPEVGEIFLQLSIFRGGFTRRVAQEIIGATLRQLGRLVFKSLLRYDQNAERYQVHELLRQYGVEKLAEDAAQETAVRDRHAAYYCTFLHERETPLKSAGVLEALEEIGTEIDNIRQAWAWAAAQGQIENLEKAAESLAWFYFWPARHQEASAAFQQAVQQLEHLADQKQPDPGKEYLLLVRLYTWQARFESELENNKEAYRLSRAALDVLDKPELADQDTRREKAFFLLQTAGYLTGVREDINSRYVLGLSLYRELNDSWGVSLILSRLGQNSYYEYQRAEAYYKEALDINRTLGHPLQSVWAWMEYGYLIAMQGRFEDGQKWLNRAYETSLAINYRPGIVGSLSYLGEVAVLQGQFAEAGELFSESIEQNPSQRLGALLAWARYSRLGALLHQGRYETVRKQALEGLAEYQQKDMKGQWAVCRVLLDRLKLVEGEAREARGQLLESIQIYPQEGADEVFKSKVRSALSFTLQETDENWAEQVQHHLEEAIQVCVDTRSIEAVLTALSAAAYFFAVTGRLERAVEMYALVSEQPFVANSRWFADVVGYKIEAIAAALPEKNVEAARVRGRQGDIWQTAESLLEEWLSKQ